MDRQSAAQPPDVELRPAPPPEPRQRWRIVFRREPVPVEQVGRAGLDAWQAALVRSGLPVAGLDAAGEGRARIAFGAPLPAAVGGEAELAELWLLERVPLWRLREALSRVLPEGYGWVAAENIWLGAPPLAGQVAAADWRIELAGVGPGDVDRLRAGVRALLTARTLWRVRLKAGADKRYDLRPLLVDASVEVGPPPLLLARTRFDPALGSGRPEEVAAALAEAAGVSPEVGPIVRERLLLAEDLRRGSPRR